MQELKNTIKRNIQQYTMIILLLLIWAIFFFTTQGVFLTPMNLTNLFLQMAFIGIASSTMVLIMVCGHIDLSVGSVIGFCGAVIAYLLKFANWNIVPALIVTILCGSLVGIWKASG